MEFTVSGSTVHLQGNWTKTGLGQDNIESLAGALQQVRTEEAETLHIDCGHVKAIDMIGLQIIEIWMKIASFRGIKPVLVNIPRELKGLFQYPELRYWQ